MPTPILPEHSRVGLIRTVERCATGVYLPTACMGDPTEPTLGRCSHPLRGLQW